MAIILVVEDDPELRNIARRTLERSGYTVLEAGNGEEALAVLQDHTPNLMIVDISMPVMSGDVFLEHVQKWPEKALIPVIVLTAYPSFREMATQMEVSRFLNKPVRPSDILTVVRDILGESD